MDSKRISAALQKLQAEDRAEAARKAREGGRGVSAGGGARVWVSLSEAYLRARAEAEKARARAKGKAPMVAGK